MRKTILKITLGGALAVTAAMGVQMASSNKTVSNLFMQNVEALANGEDGGDLNPYYEAGKFYCRCKENSNGINGCYGGNAISLRASCYKGSANIMCNNYDSNCPN